MSDFNNGLLRGLGSGGINGLIGAIASAGHARQRAYQDGAVKGAHASLYGEQAKEKANMNALFADYSRALQNASSDTERDRFTALRQGAYNTNAQQAAQAMGTLERIGAMREAMMSPERAGVLGQAVGVFEGKPAYDNVNDSGVGLNRYTGAMETQHQGLYGRHGVKVQAQAEKDRAQAKKAERVGNNGGGNEKPLPVQALKMEDEALEAIGLSSAIGADVNSLINQIDAGALDLGVVNNWINRGRNFTGMSNEQSRNLASFEATIEKIRNDSLRLNKGVQTEGDAIRALNELMSNINDPGVVRSQLQRLAAINERAANIQKARINNIRANYGARPVDAGEFENVPTAIGAGQPNARQDYYVREDPRNPKYAPPQRTAADVYGNFGRQPNSSGSNVDSLLDKYR